MKTKLNKQVKSLVSILLFSIAIMLSGNVIAGKPVRVATEPAYAIGDPLIGGGIVFYIEDVDNDGLGTRGLAAQIADDAPSNDWYEAKAFAEENGPGWRLPTKHELNLLRLQKGVVGGFVPNALYWSSTPHSTCKCTTRQPEHLVGCFVV